MKCNLTSLSTTLKIEWSWRECRRLALRAGETCGYQHPETTAVHSLTSAGNSILVQTNRYYSFAVDWAHRAVELRKEEIKAAGSQLEGDEQLHELREILEALVVLVSWNLRLRTLLFRHEEDYMKKKM